MQLIKKTEGTEGEEMPTGFQYVLPFQGWPNKRVYAHTHTHTHSPS